MRDLIENALTAAWSDLADRLPTHRNSSKEIDISDVMPKDLPQFMKDNNVPDDADFDGVDNGYDGWQPYQLRLTWTVKVPTTNLDRLEYARKHFTSRAFKKVFDTLTANGYKRVGYNSGLMKEFDDTTVFDMYKTNNWDRLVKFYSLAFKKDLEVSN
jgi:hypothetical protein